MALLLINTGMLVLIALFILRLGRKHGSYLQLGVFFAAQLAINYPLRILILYFFPKASKPEYPGLIAYDNLLHLSTLQIGGILTFCVAYSLVDSRLRHHPILSRSAIEVQRSDVGIIAVVFGASVLAIAYKIATGDYISFLIGQNKILALANLVDNLVMMGWIPFAAAWYLFLAQLLKRPAHWLLFVLINAILLPYQIIQGSKTFLMLPLLIILVTYYFYRRKIPGLALVVSLLFAAYFVFPFVTSFREYIVRNYGAIPSIDQFETKRLVDEVYLDAQNQKQSVVEKILGVLGRFVGADELYNMECMVPQYVPYKHGRDLLAIPLAFVPRAIWPSKPIISTGAEYGVALGTLTSVTPFPFGEMYWNFGKAGIIIGMFIWGVVLALLMRLYDSLFRYRRLRFFLVCCYLAQIYWMTSGEGTLAMLLASLPKQIIVYGGAWYIANMVIRGQNKRGGDTIRERRRAFAA